VSGPSGAGAAARLLVVAQVAALVRVQEGEVEAHAARRQPLDRLAGRPQHHLHLATEPQRRSLLLEVSPNLCMLYGWPAQDLLHLATNPAKTACFWRLPPTPA